jgi:hypothetical protein
MSGLMTGDIILVPSDKIGARIVKFLQQSPTLWHWIVGKTYQAITRRKAPEWLIDVVEYYHVAMALNETQIIEQQSSVIISPASRIEGKRIRVWRNIGLSDSDRIRIASRARNDLNKKYDVLLIFGKTLTWLTGLGIFAMLFQWPGLNICATGVAFWHWPYDHFGRVAVATVTGDDIDDWCAMHERYRRIDMF